MSYSETVRKVSPSFIDTDGQLKFIVSEATLLKLDSQLKIMEMVQESEQQQKPNNNQTYSLDETFDSMVSFIDIMSDKKEIPYTEQLKAETKGIMTLNPEFIKREQEKRIGIDCRIASSLGRPITEKEYMSTNI